MRVKGKVVKWQNDKGFGYIEPFRGNHDVFFHENFLLNPSKRPMVGDEVSYEMTTSPGGKQRAERILFRGDVDPRERDRIFDLLYSTLSCSFLLCVGILVFYGILNSAFFIFYLLLSFITFFIYWRDKVNANTNQRRIPEKKLHFFSLIGGWPGALIAQRALHHKSRKKSFRMQFVITVILNITFLSSYCILESKLIRYDSIIEKINMVKEQVMRKKYREVSSQRNLGPIYSWENHEGKKVFSNVGFPQDEPYRNGKIEWK